MAETEVLAEDLRRVADTLEHLSEVLGRVDPKQAAWSPETLRERAEQIENSDG